MRRSLSVAAVLALTPLGLAVLVASSSATTPGRNGRIAFSADSGHGLEVFTIRPNGRGLRQVTPGMRGDATAVDWSPDGDTIVFEHDFFEPDRDVDHGQILTINADGSHLRWLTKAGVKSQPAYTPDGRHLVYMRGDSAAPQGIFIMRTDGSHRRRLTTNPFGIEFGDADPNVSPDGRTVTFVRHKVEGELQALYAVSIDGTHERQILSYRHEIAIKHDWAPSGNRIVVTTQADYPNGRSPNIATVRPDGSGLKKLTHYRGGANGAFAGSYSPNGRWIVFRVENLARERFRLYKMRPDGSDRTLISRLPFAPRSSDWSSR